MQQLHVKLEPSSISFLSALMPTMSGLYLATVLDGKKGLVILNYSEKVKDDIFAMFKSLEAQFPNEPGWKLSAGPRKNSSMGDINDS